MNIFKRIFSRTLPPTWELNPGGTVWKVQPSSGGLLAGESRDMEGRTVSFFALHPLEGRMIFSGLGVGEPWWAALELMVSDIAVIHRFPKPDMPNALGATAIDCTTGTILWRDEGIKVLCGTREIGLAQQGVALEGADLRLIDMRSGNTIENLGGDMARAEEFYLECSDDPRWEGWISASELTKDLPIFGTVSGAIAECIREQRGPAEVAQYNGFTVVSVHERSRSSADAALGNCVDNVMMILDAGGRILLNQRITTAAPGPGNDVFFIWNGMLIFIREGVTLTGMDLRKQGTT